MCQHLKRSCAPRMREQRPLEGRDAEIFWQEQSSDGTTGDEETAVGQRRAKLLAARSFRRRLLIGMYDGALQAGEGPAFLESSTVTEKTREKYQQQIRDLEEYAREERRSLETDRLLDDCVADWNEQQVCRGTPADERRGADGELDGPIPLLLEAWLPEAAPILEGSSWMAPPLPGPEPRHGGAECVDRHCGGVDEQELLELWLLCALCC